MEDRAPRIALVAHDARKAAMLEWVEKHRDLLACCTLYGTGTTGQRIIDETGLKVTCLLSGPLGGDQQLGAMIAEGKLDGMVFFLDPMTAVPHDVDVKALLRISTLYQIAAAYNERTADLIMRGLLQERPLDQE
ncbi:methylglyoxal synthase [Suttonella sp. R2A3]|uniref:methylglyoxal synthase n=1 Tax=Suttonella sp. R2A3 TaxID=2908648 RepID=UPI001F2591E7|nr:methylglyoxal synthase [Suttonella sp. R2A3]UJF24053.1 methylglyoxal synthase [Suttonella sp. R2A3]